MLSGSDSQAIKHLLICCPGLLLKPLKRIMCSQEPSLCPPVLCYFLHPGDLMHLSLQSPTFAEINSAEGSAVVKS